MLNIHHKVTEMCVRLQGFVGGQREELWNHREGCSRRLTVCVCVCELGEGAGEVDELTIHPLWREVHRMPVVNGCVCCVCTKL